MALSHTNPVDVVVIGGGVLGCAIAERISRTTAKVVLVEAESDVAEHASKGNAGVAVSYYGKPGSQQTDLINASNPLWEAITKRLNVPYRRIGGLMVALTDEEAQTLEETVAEINACGVNAQLISRAAAITLEPLVTPKIISGISMPDEGIIDPIRLTTAYASLAATNGTQFRFNERVVAIDHDEHGSRITTNLGHFRTRFIVNAAGVQAG